MVHSTLKISTYVDNAGPILKGLLAHCVPVKAGMKGVLLLLAAGVHNINRN
jgi:hypothetical protein